MEKKWILRKIGVQNRKKIDTNQNRVCIRVRNASGA